MRRKTQKLAERSKELRQRVELTNVSLRGPTIAIAPSTQKVLGTSSLRITRWLEVGSAVAKSLEEMREKLVAAQKDLVTDGRARELLERMAGACANFLHHHPEINPDAWSPTRITPDTVDDLFALRQEFAAVLLDMWDAWELASAQELLNRIKLEPPAHPDAPS